MLATWCCRVSLDAKTSRLCPALSFVGTVTYMSPRKDRWLRVLDAGGRLVVRAMFCECGAGQAALENDDGYWSLLKSIRDEPPPQLPEHYSEKFRACVAVMSGEGPCEAADGPTTSSRPVLRHRRRRVRLLDDGFGEAEVASTERRRARSYFTSVGVPLAAA